jgi:VWFA-related protein
MVRLTWLVVFGACVALSLPAQEPPPSPPASGQSVAPAPGPVPRLTPRSHEERERNYQAAHHIILNVRVTDASGNPVNGLKAEDFTLIGDQQPKEIASFRAIESGASSTHAHVIIMIDAVNNTSRNIGQFRKDIEKFLKEGQELLTYPVSFALLSEEGERVGEPSRDRDVLINELKTLTSEHLAAGCGNDVNPNEGFLAVWMPGTVSTDRSSKAADCLNLRFIRSISALDKLARHEADVPGRVIVIWIGYGWPLLSSHEFRPDTPAFKRTNFHYLAELSTDLREAQVTLDAVSSSDLFRVAELRNDHDNAFLNGVPTEDELTAGSMALQVLAHQSGGQIREQSKDIARDIAACIADAEFYYVLSFDSAPANGPDEFHSLEVKVDKPGLTVRTNTVYYAQP